VLLCDKPRGMSSHAVVSRARRALATRHVGHAGTLDPMATGVLLLAAGEACKVLRYLVLDDKRYEATVRLGVETDSLDADGRVTVESEVPALTIDAVRAAARALENEIEQRAPAISAIKQGGVALYARARRGEVVEPPARLVTAYAIDVWALRGAEVDLHVHSGKGFYVRALARDLARALGTVGHLTALRRVESGCFGLERAVPFSLLEAAAEGDPDSRRALVQAMLSIREVLGSAPAVELDAAGLDHAVHGRRIALSHVVAGTLPEHQVEPVLLCDARGRPHAIGRREDSEFRVVRGLNVDA
jgi:tRNA pseudouridine55 synthase